MNGKRSVQSPRHSPSRVTSDFFLSARPGVPTSGGSQGACVTRRRQQTGAFRRGLLQRSAPKRPMRSRGLCFDRLKLLLLPAKPQRLDGTLAHCLAACQALDKVTGHPVDWPRSCARHGACSSPPPKSSRRHAEALDDTVTVSWLQLRGAAGVRIPSVELHGSLNGLRHLIFRRRSSDQSRAERSSVTNRGLIRCGWQRGC